MVCECEGGSDHTKQHEEGLEKFKGAKTNPWGVGHEEEDGYRE